MFTNRRRGASGSEYGFGVGVVGAAVITMLYSTGGFVQGQVRTAHLAVSETLASAGIVEAEPARTIAVGDPRIAEALTAAGLTGDGGLTVSGGAISAPENDIILYQDYEDGGPNGWGRSGPDCNKGYYGMNAMGVSSAGDDALDISMVGDYYLSTVWDCDNVHNGLSLPSVPAITLATHFGGESLDTTEEDARLFLIDASGSKHKILEYKAPTGGGRGKWGPGGSGESKVMTADLSNFAGQTVTLRMTVGGKNGWGDHAVMDELLIVAR